jgi:hypothetical protein
LRNKKGESPSKKEVPMSLLKPLTMIWQAIVQWFVEHAWPEIQKLLIVVIQVVFEWLYEKIRRWLKKGDHDQQKAFNEKAEEAEKKAQQATDGAEEERFRAEAKIWREAFELYRQENEKLNAELSKILAEAVAKASETVASLKPDDIFTFSEDKIRLKPDVTLMLPPPDEKK